GGVQAGERERRARELVPGARAGIGHVIDAHRRVTGDPAREDAYERLRDVTGPGRRRHLVVDDPERVAAPRLAEHLVDEAAALAPRAAGGVEPRDAYDRMTGGVRGARPLAVELGARIGAERVRHGVLAIGLARAAVEDVVRAGVHEEGARRVGGAGE